MELLKLKNNLKKTLHDDEIIIQQLEVQLKPLVNYTIDFFEPKLKDCLRLPRFPNKVRSPVNNIIEWKRGVSKEDQVFDVRFTGHIESGSLKTLDNAVCSYKIKLKGLFVTIFEFKRS